MLREQMRWHSAAAMSFIYRHGTSNILLTPSMRANTDSLNDKIKIPVSKEADSIFMLRRSVARIGDEERNILLVSGLSSKRDTDSFP